MKKAKFHNNYKLASGACVGHYSEGIPICQKCKLRQLCQANTIKGICPKSEKEAMKIVNANT